MKNAATERRNRIRLSVAAYAYEIDDDPVMSDDEFDSLSRKIDLNAPTGHDELDLFFLLDFDPSTGVWVRKHPELEKLAACVRMVRGLQSKLF
jgi:hypothetical protein